MRSKRDVAADQMAMAPFKKGGSTGKSKKMMREGAEYARGGGIESRGKTKGKMVKMAKGGRAC